ATAPNPGRRTQARSPHRNPRIARRQRRRVEGGSWWGSRAGRRQAARTSGPTSFPAADFTEAGEFHDLKAFPKSPCLSRRTMVQDVETGRTGLHQPLFLHVPLGSRSRGSPESDRAVERTRGEGPPVRGEGHAVDPMFVALERQQL